jgi:DNA-directed RNA polymerase omega subunit
MSRFHLITVAVARNKQLLQGATARIVPDPLRRKNTSIAVEEVRRGLIRFNPLASDALEPDKIISNLASAG